MLLTIKILPLLAVQAGALQHVNGRSLVHVGKQPVSTSDGSQLNTVVQDEMTEGFFHQLMRQGAHWRNSAMQLKAPARRGGETEIEKEEDEEKGKPDILKTDKYPWWLHWLSIGIFATVFIVFFGRWFHLLWCMYSDYKKVKKENKAIEEEGLTFKIYLKYRFAYWFVWTKGSNAIILLVLTFVALLLGALAYATGVGANMWSAAYKAFVWLVAPDAGAGEMSLMGAAIGAVMSVVGLVLFALLLTLMQDSFANYLDYIKNGRSQVLETGHTVIIGLSESTLGLISELCQANEVTGGTTLVVLTHTMSKTDMEEKIVESNIDMCGSRIVVRSGNPYTQSDLALVAASSARTIVIIPDRGVPKEMRDAFVLRCLIGLRGNAWPRNGRILVVCSLVRNQALFVKAGGLKTDVVMLDEFMGKLMVQCSTHQGLGGVVSGTFGFGGSEFYVSKVEEHILGKTFSDAALHYPDAVLCGVLSENGPSIDDHMRSTGSMSYDTDFCNLCPGSDYRLKHGDNLVLLAEDTSCTEATRKPLKPPSPLVHLAHTHRSPRPSPHSEMQGKPETVLVMGWNDCAGLMVLELDTILPHGSTIIMVSPKTPAEREAELMTTYKRTRRTLEHVTSIVQVTGPLGSKHVFEELPTPLQQATRIFILADEDCHNSLHADTCTMQVLMQIRDTLRGLPKQPDTHGGPPPRISIVPEIRDAESELHCQMIKAADFIDTSGLPSQVLAMIAFQPRIAPVLDEILSAGGVTFATRTLQDYIQPGTEPPPSISFFQVQDLAGYSGDVVVGWSAPREDGSEDAASFQGNERAGEFLSAIQEQTSGVAEMRMWEINPQDKFKERQWCATRDHLVVLCSGF